MLIGLLTLFFASGWAMDVADWRVVNDTVMGGVSQSTVTQHAKQGVVFQGQLSLENNGGFTSARYQVANGDWRRYDALQLTINGDGRSYIATIRTTGLQNRGLYYRQTFQTEAGREQTLTLDLADFAPYSYGRQISGAPALTSQLSQVETIGVMLADKKSGNFSLHIADYELTPRKGYDEGSASVESLASSSAIGAVFELAIAEGAPLFNSGDVQRCVDIYRKSIENVLILRPNALTSTEQAGLKSSLNKVRRQSNVDDQAWTLRQAMDSYLAGRQR
jgi:NADH dehydrogenase [ubiquinone] 1 alpha subcomplex assembly factor 1